ncbi:MAG TPA: flavodoxin family protein [Candidatus Brocadiia bacterium]|nr:flavodoxin family protein [Planctomycetota bacterium]MDO8092209.1 flavodoxin family protein [Candidatus Brocadiales bacterium]
MIRLLAISGSPRRGGNTDLLLEQVFNGARSKGAVVNKLIASELKIASCNGCNSCMKTGNCVIKDEMQDVYPLLLDADYLVVASPVYFSGVSAQLKSLIDRCQAIWARKYILKIPLRGNSHAGKLTNLGIRPKGFFISVAGSHSGSKVFSGALSTIKAFFHTLEVDYAGDLLCYGIDGAGAITRHPDLLEQAFKIGMSACVPPCTAGAAGRHSQTDQEDCISGRR